MTSFQRHGNSASLNDLSNMTEKDKDKPSDRSFRTFGCNLSTPVDL